MLVCLQYVIVMKKSICIQLSCVETVAVKMVRNERKMHVNKLYLVYKSPCPTQLSDHGLVISFLSITHHHWRPPLFIYLGYALKSQKAHFPQSHHLELQTPNQQTSMFVVVSDVRYHTYPWIPIFWPQVKTTNVNRTHTCNNNNYDFEYS